MAAPLFACHRQFFADFYGDIYRGFGEFYMRNPVFLFCMWVACKGTRLKRVTIGLMLASTILALNGLYDSCITSLPYFGLGLNDLWYLLFRLASTLFCICASAITSRNATLN